MSRRNERRDEEIVAAVLMGLTMLRDAARKSKHARQEAERATRFAERDRERAARYAARDAERAARQAQWPGRQRSGLGSIALMVLMVGGFIVLGLFMSVLASIAALAQSPAGAMLCALPLALVAFLIWATRRSGQQAGAGRPADQVREAPTVDHYSWEPVVGAGGSAQTQLQSIPAPAAQQAPATQREKPLAEEYPEKGARSPSEYRQRAASYRRRIESLLKKRRPGPLAERFRSVLDKLKSWEERVGQLADRLVLFETDDLIQRDLREVPGHVDRLKRQAALEADPEMRKQITRTQGAYEEQLRQLRLLARVMRRTRFNLDDTLAAMGTVYSQVQVLNAMDIDAPAAARIDDEIGREVDRLNDLMTALSEVYASSDGSGEAADEAATGEAALDTRRERLRRSAAE